MNVLVCALLGGLIFSPGLHAGVYKWTDENGRVHFSDRPVSDLSTEVKIKQAPPSSPSSSSPQQRQEKMRKMLDAFEEERNEKKEARQKAKKEREKREKKCLYAKDRYNSHNRASGIYGYDKEGQKNYLNDAERKTHIQRLKAEVDRWCK